MVDRTAELGNLLDQTATEKAILGGGGQKNGFDLVRKRFISMGHLQLHLKIREHPEPAQKGFGLAALSIVNRQAIKTIDLDIG